MPTRVVRSVRSWPTRSQLGARRNAMIACTRMAARRAEREDVEDFLAQLSGAPTETVETRSTPARSG